MAFIETDIENLIWRKQQQLQAYTSDLQQPKQQLRQWLDTVKHLPHANAEFYFHCLTFYIFHLLIDCFSKAKNVQMDRAASWTLTYIKSKWQSHFSPFNTDNQSN